jgi:hypothetical protein
MLRVAQAATATSAFWTSVASMACFGRRDMAVAQSAAARASTEQAHRAGLNPAVTVSGVPKPPNLVKTAVPTAEAAAA